MKLKCPDEIVGYMHDYLDGEISPEHEKLLKKHLHECGECLSYFHEIERAVAFVQSTSRIKAPDHFTDRVINRLPKEKKIISVQRWIKHHPLLTASTLFLMLMGGSLFSIWNQNDQFSVTKQDNLRMENETVIVPAGEVVQGNIRVQNGDIRIEGEVQGDVTVINGQNYMAQAGHVTGNIYVIDEMFEWLWFNIKDAGKALVQAEEAK
jgi:anti-sigma factor RsiW